MLNFLFSKNKIKKLSLPYKYSTITFSKSSEVKLKSIRKSPIKMKTRQSKSTSFRKKMNMVMKIRRSLMTMRSQSTLKERMNASQEKSCFLKSTLCWGLRH